MARRRMRKNGKKDAKKQAEAMGLKWDIEGDDHNWDRLSIFLDAWQECPAEKALPHGIGVYRQVLTDTNPEGGKIGGDTEFSYWKSVRSTAKSIDDDIRSGDLDPEELVERLDEAADASHWVTYTHANLATMVFSPNWLQIDVAADDGIVEFSADQGNLSRLTARAAFFAFRQDVADAMESADDEDDDDWDE